MNISLANALRAIQNAAEYRAGTEGVVGAVGIVEGDGVEVNVLGEAWDAIEVRGSVVSIVGGAPGGGSAGPDDWGRDAGVWVSVSGEWGGRLPVPEERGAATPEI